MRNAGTEASTTWTATLSSVEQTTAAEELSPCVLIIGNVAGARDSLTDL